jgi:lysophospholipase
MSVSTTGPASGAGGPSEATGFIDGVDGARLAWRAWESEAPQATLMLVHGLGDHAGRYAGFGRAMAEAGISTFAVDLRGHGRSEGRRGHVPSFDTHLEEIDRFRREVAAPAAVRARAGAGAPLFLLGQSMGGLLALRYLQEYGAAAALHGAVICSPWLATAAKVPRWKTALLPIVARLAPALHFRHGLRAEDLSRDDAVVAAYRDDLLTQPYITPRTFREASTAMRVVEERADRLRGPLLFMLGSADRIVVTERAVAFARSLDGVDVTVRVVEGAYHELLLEVDRDAHWREVSRWILARA